MKLSTEISPRIPAESSKTNKNILLKKTPNFVYSKSQLWDLFRKLLSIHLTILKSYLEEYLISILNTVILSATLLMTQTGLSHPSRQLHVTIKRPKRHQRRHSGIFIVNFEHISHLVLVFLLLTLSR